MKLMSNMEHFVKENQTIAIAALGVPDGCTIFTEIVLRGALKALLRRRGVEWLEWSGTRQPDFVVELITVRERGPALQAVHATLDEIGILGLCHIAYFDCDEIYWRTVHPDGAPPFDQFLNPALARNAATRVKMWLEVYRDLERRQKPLEESPKT